MILWLLYRKYNSRRNCRRRATSWETIARAQKSSTAPCERGKKMKENYHPLISSDISGSYLNSCCPQPNYPISNQILSCLPPPKTLNSISSSTIFTSTVFVYSFIIFAPPCQKPLHSYHRHLSTTQTYLHPKAQVIFTKHELLLLS